MLTNSLAQLFLWFSPLHDHCNFKPIIIQNDQPCGICKQTRCFQCTVRHFVVIEHARVFGHLFDPTLHVLCIVCWHQWTDAFAANVLHPEFFGHKGITHTVLWVYGTITKCFDLSPVNRVTAGLCVVLARV